jgi:hypothetical protein
MPVEVHIPVRLRVSARALAEHPAQIDAAVERAVARALGRSRSALHHTYGNYLSPRFDAPDIRWTGAALASVSPAVRADTERRLAGTVDRLAREAQRALGKQSETPLMNEAAEPYDPRRALGLGRYRMDSYHDGSETAVALQGGSTAAPPPMTRGWLRVDVLADYDPLFVRTETHHEAARQNVTLSSLYGLLVRRASQSGWTLLLTADDFAGGRRIALNFGPQMKRRVSGLAGGQMHYEEFELIPPLTVGSMTEEALPDNRPELLDRLHTLMAATIGTDLRNSLDVSQQMDDNLLTREELDGLIAQEVDSEISRMAEALHGRRYLLRIDWGDLRFNLGFDRSIAAMLGWDGTTPAAILPALTDVPAGRIDLGTGALGNQGAGGAARPHGGGGDSGGGDGGGSRYGTHGDGGAHGPGGHIFPALGGGSPLCCQPFLESEPPLQALAGGGAGLRRLIAEIAERLDMVPCEYAATFCIGAAQTLAGHAAAIARLAGSCGAGELTRPAGAGPQSRGNLGHAEFRPVASRGIQLLRRLSQAAARIAQLRRLIRTFYLNDAGRTLLTGEYATNPVGWVLRFEEAVSPPIKEGVGEMFAQACQLVMLQLLDTSAQQIAARKENLHAYAPLFRDILVRRLSDIGTLTTLRDRLRSYELAQSVNRTLGSTGGAVASVALPEWSIAARALARACVATDGFAHLPGAAHEIVEQDGVARIRDAHGFMWTRAALEQAIAEQRGGAEALDPLIEQLSDIPGTVERFRRDPDSAAPLLSDLLDDMSRLNREKRQEAAADLRFGLRVGRISSENPRSTAVPGLPYDLAGVHQLAHEQLYPFFGAETDAYAEGVNHIFGVELGIQGLEHFFTFTGLVLLAVVCAPAAFVAGVQLAAREVEHANARRDLYRSLINPELVLNRTEIELERYIAYVGLALSLLPEAGTAARAISVGVRGAARRGAMVGLALAGRSIVRHVSRQVTEQLAHELLPALIREVATNLLMEQVIVPAVIGPIVEAVERELRVRMSVGGLAGAERLIQQIEDEARRRAGQPASAPNGGSH